MKIISKETKCCETCGIPVAIIKRYSNHTVKQQALVHYASGAGYICDTCRHASVVPSLAELLTTVCSSDIGEKY